MLGQEGELVGGGDGDAHEIDDVDVVVHHREDLHLVVQLLHRIRRGCLSRSILESIRVGGRWEVGGGRRGGERREGRWERGRRNRCWIRAVNALLNVHVTIHQHLV